MSKTSWECALVSFFFMCACLVSVGSEDDTDDLSSANFNHRLLPVLIARDMARDAGDRYPGNFGMPILNGADAIRPELDDFEEPLPNPQWPAPMAHGAIYFGGTDHGRYIPESLTLNDDVRLDVLVITQNALADNRYAEVLRHRLSGKCWVPPQEDIARAFETYITEVQSGKRQANGDLKIENGRVQVTGALAVMQINEIISKDIFDHNKTEHDFYVEESYVIPWMYDYLSPHGFMMKLNAEEVGRLHAGTCKADMEFWDWQTRRLLDDPQFCRRRAERCRLIKGLNGGNEDTDYRHRVACRAFSKLRSSIAGLYARKGLMKEAQVAFREACVIDPQSPEATFRYVQEALVGSDKWNAIFDLIEFTVRINPESKHSKEHAAGMRKPVRTARDAKATMNALRNKYKVQEIFVPETLMEFSSRDLSSLADACLDYFHVNFQFGNVEMARQSAFWLQGNPSHTNTFERAWRSAKVFKQLASSLSSNKNHNKDREDYLQNGAANVLAALKFPEADKFEVQHESALVLAEAGLKDCVWAIDNAMKFPESQNPDTLVQYAKILESFEQEREAVKVINRALPLVQNAQPSNVVEAAKLMLELNREKYTPNVQSLLRPLLRRPNVSWTAETFVDFALVSHDVQMPQEACEALEKGMRMNPVLVDTQFRQNPKLKEIWKLLRQRSQP